jgi:hypothetical protein
MEIKQDFYITLSGQSDTFQYIFDLPKEIVFYSNWEVGVSDISLSGEFHSDFSDKDRTILVKKNSDKDWHSLTLSFLAYSNISTIVDQINTVFQKASNPFKEVLKVILNKDTKLVTFEVHKQFEIRLSSKLYQIFNVPSIIEISGDLSSYISEQLVFNPPHFYISVNIVDESPINTKNQRNLKTFCINNNWSVEPYVKHFSNIQYFPVRTKHFNQIHLNLEQYFGHRILTDHTELNITLHFRK